MKAASVFTTSVLLFCLVLVSVESASAVQFAGSQTGPDEWTYDLTYDPHDNYSICQPSTTITLTGLAGVTQAFPPQSTDFPPGLDRVNLQWTPAVLSGGTVVQWTHVGSGTGNFRVAKNVFGFRIIAPGAIGGSVAVETDGFEVDGSCADRDISTTTDGPAAVMVPTLPQWALAALLIALVAGALVVFERRGGLSPG